MADNLIITIAQEFLETSSSDSDFEYEAEVVPKISNFISNVVYSYTDNQFKSAFRLERRTVNYIITKFSQSDIYKRICRHGGSPSATAENHILSFIWFASNKSCLRDVAERFGIGVTTCYRQITRVMDFLNSISCQIIKFPKSSLEKEEYSSEFKKISTFPGVIGCIDCTSITIQTPAKKIKSTYVNRHDIPSITLQGICDYKKRFTDVFTGPPGKIHDSRTFSLSFISKDLPNICNHDFHLLGDSAYSIREYLLTPYKDYGNLTIAQKNYNYRLCSVRVLIENAFGMLKGRFRQLTCVHFHTVDKITKFIIACCVLHNLCLNFNDEISINDENSDDMHDEILQDRDEILKHIGELKRNFICETLNI